MSHLAASLQEPLEIDISSERLNMTKQKRKQKERREILIERLGKERPVIMSSFFSGHPWAISEITSTGKVPQNVCGSPCCIAGEAAIQFPKEFRKAAKSIPYDKYDALGGWFAKVAGMVLGLPAMTFFVSDWPNDIAFKWNQTSSRARKTRLKLAIAAIRHFEPKEERS